MLAALVTLPVAARAALAELAALRRSASRRALDAALAGCSARQRRQALAWLSQGRLEIPEPMDLRRLRGSSRDWVPLRPEPGSPWILDYLAASQVPRLADARLCRRLPDGSAVRLGGKGWQLSHGELRGYLLVRDGQICALCGRPIHHQATVEHLVPRALAPLWADRDPMPRDHWLWSMAPAHWGCNGRRGCRPDLPRASSPQVRLSAAVLARVLPDDVRLPDEVSGFLQLSRVVAPERRKAVWRRLRRRLDHAPACLYRDRLLAYRGGRLIVLPPVLRAPGAVHRLRAELRQGRAPAPRDVLALSQLPPERWPEACAQLRLG